MRAGVKKWKDDPPEFFGVLSFGTICNAVNWTVFSVNGTLCDFLSFLLLFEGFRSFDEILRVIFITSVIESTCNPVFMDIVQRCKFCCVECWLHVHTCFQEHITSFEKDFDVKVVTRKKLL